MQTVRIETTQPGRVIERLHDQGLLGAWRDIGGIDLRSWQCGNRLAIGAEDGPNSATLEAHGRALVLEHELDAEGWFIRATIEAIARQAN